MRLGGWGILQGQVWVLGLCLGEIPASVQPLSLGWAHYKTCPCSSLTWAMGVRDRRLKSWACQAYLDAKGSEYALMPACQLSCCGWVGHPGRRALLLKKDKGVPVCSGEQHL